MNAPRSPAGDDLRPVFVTGASGYIGGRLVPRLLARGQRVRCLARDPRKLATRPWANDPRVQIVAADAADEEALARGLSGCRAAYYLIHSMLAAGDDYAARDRQLAATFARAAARAGLPRIVYLGGLGETAAGLSEHLGSRREVETGLASGPVPVTVLRAAMILGSGSASFEILRYLVERLPVMVTPRWVETESQPIAVQDVLHYLIAVLDAPATSGLTLDIGGREVLSYRELMQIMAAALGLRRRVILPIPVLTPRLSSLWIHLVTPLSHRIARPLADGLRNRLVCRGAETDRLLPHTTLPVREAIGRALADTLGSHVETSWSDAGPIPGDPDWSGGTVFSDRRELILAAPPSAAWRAVLRIGGGNGWYGADFLWRLRGALDRLLGGPGLRRGRRDAATVGFGDALDFWRVTAVVAERRLDLRAEMRLPGEALLRFELEPVPGAEPRTRLVQTARFKPRGLLGLGYWYAALPLHGFVFRRMVQGIRRAAQSPAPRTAPGLAAAGS